MSKSLIFNTPTNGGTKRTQPQRVTLYMEITLGLRNSVEKKKVNRRTKTHSSEMEIAEQNEMH